LPEWLQAMLDIRAEILRVIDKYLERVSPTGSDNVMALCPFHGEDTPSFAMNTTNGVYFCHACHAKGNLLTFLRGVGVSRQLIDIQYKEVIEEARRYTPPGPNPLDPGVRDLAPIPEGTLGLFDGYTIPSLLNDGYAESTLCHFDVGYDRWHQRITYPIRDVQGKIVGISGRAIHPDVKPKYKIYNREYVTWNLPERGPWDRRKVLYNLHNVLPTMLTHQKADSYIVIVEGFKACMWLWQSGIKNVVALLGSYFSWEHRWFIEKFHGAAYFFLDNNYAGTRGTYQASQSLLKTPIRKNEEVYGSVLDLFVVEYPERLQCAEDAQPDSLTPEEVRTQLFKALPYQNWLSKKTGDAH